MIRALLRRPSLWLFVLIVLAGAAGPALLAHDAADTVGAPFARPVWWRRSLSSSKKAMLAKDRGVLRVSGEGFTPKAQLTGGENGLSFCWDSSAPEIFALEGEISAQQERPVTVIWHTPAREFELARLSGRATYWLNLDARDMILKRQLGLPLIGRGADHLFPSAGTYRLEVRGADRFNLKLSLPGRRQGLLGTDQRGRDVFALLLSGIGTSLTVGIAATVTATLLGLGFGLTAGYAGGVTDMIIMRAVDILLAIPTLPILMTLAGIWGKGLWQLVLILSIFSWMGTARSVRALTLSVREQPWVEELRALGAKRRYILWRHLVPETSPIVLANLALGVPGAILSEAGLSFLGLSDPRLISWGRMLHEAHSFGAFTEGAWWLILPPGLGIVAVCLIFMDIGRFLEEQIDPRLGGKEHA